MWRGDYSAASADFVTGQCVSIRPGPHDPYPLCGGNCSYECPAVDTRRMVTLNNGLGFPLVSFGLWVYSDATAALYTRIALSVGIRNFFASVLARNQRGFGNALKASSIPRGEIFVCGSVSDASCVSYEDCLRTTTQLANDNLAALQLPYLDMIMLDYPATVGECSGIQGQWAAFEQFLREGKTKSIAVSNFSPKQLDCIMNAGNSSYKPTPPAVNQIVFHIGMRGDSGQTVADNKARGGITVQAYNALNRGALATNRVAAKIGEKYGKSAAQVALRWIVQKGATVMTRSTSEAHFIEDLEVVTDKNFELSTADMTTLDSL